MICNVTFLISLFFINFTFGTFTFQTFKLKMSKIKVPPGWLRKQVGKKVVYISEPPRVRIWNLGDFDKLKAKGRFADIDREMLNFSLKVIDFFNVIKIMNKNES